MNKSVMAAPFICLLLGMCMLFEREGRAQDESISYARLYSDSDGTTHFVDEQMPWTPAAGDARNMTTAHLDSANVSLYRNTFGMDADYHPANQKQLVYVLKGSLQVVAGDGESRVFVPGTILLVEDTSGQGHISRNAGDGELLMALVGVP